jgi:hypothetical protein
VDSFGDGRKKSVTQSAVKIEKKYGILIRLSVREAPATFAEKH